MKTKGTQTSALTYTFTIQTHAGIHVIRTISSNVSIFMIWTGRNMFTNPNKRPEILFHETRLDPHTFKYF